MLTVEQLIGDLLIQNNCVIIPSFGGFVAQRISARIDESKGTIVPPRKSVMFNKQLINNDGLLIAAFSQAQGISYAEAALNIQGHIQEWESTLQAGNRITIDRVGILFYDQERNLCFEQDRFYNLLLQSFGLSAVHFVSSADAEAVETRQQIQQVVKAIELEEEKTSKIQTEAVLEFTNDPVVPVFESVREEQIATNKEEAKIRSLRPKSTAWRYIAAACMLPIAFYSFWIPAKTDVLESGVISINDFNPFYQPTKGVYSPPTSKHTFVRPKVNRQLDKLPEGVTTFSYELDEDTYVPVSIKKKPMNHKPEEVISEIQENPPKNEVIQQPITTSAKGFIIVGSYSNKSNAQELVDMLAKNNIAATILESEGKIRVSAGNASQFKVLDPQLKALGISGWVLK